MGDESDMRKACIKTERELSPPRIEEIEAAIQEPARANDWLLRLSDEDILM